MRAATRRSSIQLLAVLTVLLLFGMLFILMGTAQSATVLYPDLKARKAGNLRFDTATIDGTTHQVLRFTAIIWNAGEGPLEMRGENLASSGKTRVFQRIYDSAGNLALEQNVGEFVWHEAHQHWHFEDFAEYQLWTRSNYDAWVASGRTQGQAQRRGTKTTFCIIDSQRIKSLPGSPSSAVYAACNQELQGISVGWGDKYKYSLPEQWIDLGTNRLPDGDYVLRIIADPVNRIYESPEKSDSRRESQLKNESVRFFNVTGNSITLK